MSAPAVSDVLRAARRRVDEKRTATLKARVALWGGALYAGESDNGRPEWIVSRWALCRSFSSLDDVEAFLDYVGARG